MDAIASLVKFKWQWVLFFCVVLMAWGLLVAMQPELQTIQNSNSNVIKKLLYFCLSDASDAPYITIVLMWMLMSVAMMAPTAIPAIITYSNLPQATITKNSLIIQFIAGFLIIWLGFSFFAAILQIIFSNIGIIDDFGQSNNLWLNAVLLIIAGLYQFSSLKNACISKCRTPMAFFMEHWTTNAYNSVSLGVHYGAICVGCCWALMLIGFVGGIMSLGWMTAAMLLMTIEKLNDIGKYITRPLAIMLILSGLIFGFLALTN